MRTRRLSLQRETLTALSNDDLAVVAGAAGTDYTIPHRACVDEFVDRIIGQSGGC